MTGVTLLLPGELQHADPEVLAAQAWLAEQQDLAGRTASLAEPPHAADTLWLHAAAPVLLEVDALARLRAWRPRGLLLTGGAAIIAHQLRAAPRPAARTRTWHDEEDDLFFHDTFTESPRLRGHAGFRAHPLFDGLHNGAYTWRPRAGEVSHEVAYARAAAEHAVRIVAMERAYIHVNAERVTAWEHHGNGECPILCIGAYVSFMAQDPAYRAHLHRLLRNALQHCAHGCTADAHAYWPTRGHSARADASLRLPHIGPQRPGRVSFVGAPLRLAGDAPSDPFTLAGRRALTAGTEGEGVHELWVHPIRALRAFSVRGSTPVAAEVTALGVERTIRCGESLVLERVLVPHELGALVIEWEVTADTQLDIEWQTDLRLMWPYPPGALGDVLWRTDAATFTARAGGTPDVVCCHLSQPPVRWTATSVDAAEDAGPAVHVRASFELAAGSALRFVCAASSSGEQELDATLAALRDPVSLTRARSASLRRMQSEGLELVTPEPTLDRAFAWAKLRLDSYMVTTPGVGRSLVAGYWHARPGWHDGRPGYAWYFGRDAVWTALASLAVGDFAAARDVIRFLGEKQDVSGKILHECTTSGLVHYDAADATPLYLLLVARHHAWTGETGFLSGEWERVQRALRFCIATDTDGDELIENPGEGHGWIEFGPLGGGKLTFYNAGIWVAALRELAITAEDIGDRALAQELHTRARRARAALEERFFDPAQQRHALKAWQENGEWRADFTPTATHAVPLLLGVADADHAARWLDDVAAEGFNAPWGVRMIPDSDPLFNPKSYHGGAVWPLYTGWTAWAEYAAGRDQSGLRHLLANAELVQERGKGAFDEVMHGRERIAAGVCPDQAWSTAMSVAPLVYGMLGVEPDASRNRLRLRPQIPPQWEHLEARSMPLADCAVTLRYERHQQRHVFRLEQERGAAPVRVILEPVLYARALRAATVDGVPATLTPVPFAGRMMVPVQLVLDAERVVELHTEPPEA